MLLNDTDAGTEQGAVSERGERWRYLLNERRDDAFASTRPASADANDDSDWLESIEDDDQQPPQ